MLALLDKFTIGLLLEDLHSYFLPCFFVYRQPYHSEGTLPEFVLNLVIVCDAFALMEH